jgi:hypothetical protein
METMKRTPLFLLFVIVVVIEIMFILFSWKNTYFQNPYLVITADNLASAQVARNLVNGKGYVTDSLSLYEVALYDKKGWLSEGPPWKNTYRFPLPIISMAALFKMFGDSHFVANYLYPSLFHLLALMALFALTYLLFQSGIVASIASLMFVTNNGLLFTMLNKSEGADIFFFILSLIIFFLWDRRPKDFLLLLLGLVLGVSFLNRFNEGAILWLTYLIVISMKKRLGLKGLSVYLIGFLIPVIPFLWYNAVTLGTPFFSSNSYFQLIENSILSKYMNPWWKLNYDMDVLKPFAYPMSYPSEFFMRAFTNVFKYTLPEFLKLRGSFWWWVPLAFVLIRRQADGTIKEMGIIFFITLGLHIILVAPLGLNIRYVQFLFVPLIIVAAKTVYDWYVSGAKSRQEFIAGPERSVPLRRRPKEIFFLGLTLFIIPFSLHGKVSLIVYLLITFITILLLVVSIIQNRLGIVLLYSSLILLISSVLWLEDRFKMYDIKAYTAEDPAVLEKIEDTTSPGQIILASHPWNPAWFSKRPSLPIPEYPDEIYLLMKKYNLNIAVLYLSNMDAFLRHANPRTPISYHSYARLTEKTLPIKGFTRKVPQMRGSVLLYRDSDLLTDILNTKEIDVGGVDSNSHLVYGFSPPGSLEGSTVCWVLRDTGALPFDRQKFRFLEKEKVREYDNPNAEVTFLRDGVSPIRRITIRLFNLNPGEIMSVVMNSNLFSYGERGFLVAEVQLRNGWNIIDMSLKGDILRQGLNKLSFWFKEQKSLSSFPLSEISPGDLPTERLAEVLSVAFDKVYFEYDNDHSSPGGLSK